MKTNIVNIAKSAMFIMFGVAAIVFALGTVISNPVKADNPATLNESGKIQMATSGFLSSNGKIIYEVIVWNTETGKSKIYGFNGKDAMVAENFQLPSSPLY
jgi:hypothetical protein